MGNVALAVLVAYLLPAGALIRRAATRGDSESRPVGTLSGTATLANGSKAPFTLELSGRSSCALTVGAATVTFARGQATGDDVPMKTLLEGVCTLATLRDGGPGEADAALRRLLGGRNVPLAPVALSRLDGTVGVVIGAAEGQLDRPQLWVSRGASRPIRFLWQSDGKLWDARLGEWGSTAVGDAFPRTLALWDGDKQLLRLSAENSSLRGEKSDDGQD